MPPLPSDAEPRPPEDFAPLLATKEPVLLVGGQAVNLWAMYYETRTAALAPFVSRDVDVLGGFYGVRLYIYPAADGTQIR